MPRSQAWSDAQIQAALALAAATSLREAARQTGVPFGTLARHQAAIRHRAAGRAAARPIESKRRKTETAVLEVRDAVIEQAIGAAAEHVAGKVMGMAEDLQRVAGKALKQVEEQLDEAERPDGKPDHGWVRVLVGVVAQALEKSQLLTGRPTTRQALEGTVTQQHDMGAILADPDAVALARLLYRRQLAGAEDLAPPAVLQVVNDPPVEDVAETTPEPPN